MSRLTWSINSLSILFIHSRIVLYIYRQTTTRGCNASMHKNSMLALLVGSVDSYTLCCVQYNRAARFALLFFLHQEHTTYNSPCEMKFIFNQILYSTSDTQRKCIKTSCRSCTCINYFNNKILIPMLVPRLIHPILFHSILYIVYNTIFIFIQWK